MKYRDHSWMIQQKIPIRNGRKMGFVWACIHCLATLSKTETGHPTLNEVVEDGIHLNCDMQAVKDVMES